MLKAYFDDTGETEQAVGGCVTSEEVWAALDGEWSRALNDAGLKWFHARDFENRRHADYAHLSAAAKDGLFEGLLALLAQHIRLPRHTGDPWGAYICAIAPPGAVRMLDHFHEQDRALRKGQPQPRTSMKRFTEDVVAMEHDAYCVCLGRCFRTMLDECGASDTHPVHVTVADQSKRYAKIDFVYRMALSIPRWSGCLAGLSSGPEMNPRHVRPLQAADFVAYYLAKSKRKPEDERACRAAKTLRPQFLTLCDGLGVTAGWLAGR